MTPAVGSVVCVRPRTWTDGNLN